jgi:hypothetical protein
MKKLLFTIAIGLVGMTAQAQTQDPVIVGARKYYKSILKNPASYIEYSAKKETWNKSDELLTELNVILDVHLVDRQTNDNEFFDYQVLAINNLVVNLKKLKEKYELGEQYVDSNKFVSEVVKIKENKLKTYNFAITVDTTQYSWSVSSATNLERAKKNGNVDDIIKYTKEVEHFKYLISKIDSVVGSSDDYKSLAYIKHKKLEEKYLKYSAILDTINTLKKDTTSLVVDGLYESKLLNYTRAFIKSEIDLDKYGDESLVFSDFMQLLRTKNSYETFEKQKAYLKRGLEIKNELAELKKKPSLDKILYYYVVLDCSGTNSYGSRVRSKEFIYFKNGVYSTDVDDVYVSN